MNNDVAVPERYHGPKSPVILRTVTADEAGQRIDNFLMRHFKTVPRSRVYRLMRKGEVRVNRKRVDAEYRDGAGVGPQQACDHAQRRGLAGAVGADEGVEFARTDSEIERVDRRAVKTLC